MQQISSTESDRHLSKVIKIDESQIQTHLDQMVRSTVEEMPCEKGLLIVFYNQVANIPLFL